MKQIFENYGEGITVFVVVICLVGIFILLMKADATGVVYQQFSALLQSFFTTIQSQISGALGGGTP